MQTRRAQLGGALVCAALAPLPSWASAPEPPPAGSSERGDVDADGEEEEYDDLYNVVGGEAPSPSGAPPAQGRAGGEEARREKAGDDSAPGVVDSDEEDSGGDGEDSLLSRALSWRRRDHQFDVGVLGSLGAGVCHFLVAPCGVTTGAAVAVPWVSFGPGVGVRGRYRYQLSENWGARFEITASFGSSKDGTMLGMFGSYGGTAGLYYRWVDVGWVAFFSEAHVGIRSISLIPVPLYGIGHELAFYPLAWWDQPWVSWDITGGLSTDLLVIAPAPSVHLRTQVTVAVFGARVGVEVRGDADAAIGVFTNSAGATVGARLVVGYAL